VDQPTHTHNHTLDVVITRAPISLVSNLSVSLPSISDHSIIHFHLNLILSSSAHYLPDCRTSIIRQIDISCFESDVRTIELYRISSYESTPNLDPDKLFSLYDSTMEDHLDKHAPRRIITIRKKVECPWFDRECAVSKRLTRRLECQSLKDPANAERRNLWRTQIKTQRRFVSKQALQLSSSKHRRCLRRWSNSVEIVIYSLLSPPVETSSSIIPDALLDYFGNKTDAIRDSTKDVPPPTFPDPLVRPPGLMAFEEVTNMDVEKLLKDSTTKQCELDSMLHAGPSAQSSSPCLRPHSRPTHQHITIPYKSTRTPQTCNHPSSNKETGPRSMIRSS